jgi:hypothetical protein
MLPQTRSIGNLKTYPRDRDVALKMDRPLRFWRPLKRVEDPRLTHMERELWGIQSTARVPSLGVAA